MWEGGAQVTRHTWRSEGNFVDLDFSVCPYSRDWTQDCKACLQEPLPRSAFLGTARLWSVERVVSATQQKFRKSHKNTHYDENWDFCDSHIFKKSKKISSSIYLNQQNQHII